MGKQYMHISLDERDRIAEMKSLGFKTLEVNFTYYTLPSPKSFLSMRRKTSRFFEFAVKAHKSITHEISPENTIISGKFEKFLSALRPLIE
jgi:uncharacterized protein YecE (DUF72 family)